MLEWWLYLFCFCLFFHRHHWLQYSLGGPIFWGRTAPKLSQGTYTKHFIQLSECPDHSGTHPAGRWLLATAGLSDVEVVQAKTYLTILMAGTALDLIRHSLNSYFGGLGKTKVILLSTFVMAIANVGANYVLIFGKLGFPELGIAGAGYGTVFAWFTGALTLAIVYFQQVRLPEYQILKSFQLDLGILKKLVRYGFASGLEITLPIFAIDLLILAFQSYGIIVSTAITVAFTWIHTLFIPVIGLEIGTMSLTGRFVGARDPDAATDSVFSGLFFWPLSMRSLSLWLVC